MHYANGRAAKAGDLVRGKGYNIKHEIVGLLIFANPAATACNCQVATVTIEATVEYGQLDAFVALDPQTGEVLPAETE
jgi:hypothetical protein